MIGISEQLRLNCLKTRDRDNWLSQLPSTIRKLEHQWSLTLGEPFDDDGVSCAWVPELICQAADAALRRIEIGLVNAFCVFKFNNGVREKGTGPSMRKRFVNNEAPMLLINFSTVRGFICRSLPLLTQHSGCRRIASPYLCI